MEDLFQAINKQDFATVKQLLEGGASVHNRCETGNTLLMQLADPSWGPPDEALTTPIANLLIEKGIDLHAVNNHGVTAMWHALRTGNIGMVAVLKRQGLRIADTMSIAEYLNDFWPRHASREKRKRSEAVLVLVMGEDIPLEKANVKGLSPLCIACKEGNSKAIELLLKAGVDAALNSNGGNSPLEYYTNYAWRARSEGFNTIKALLDHGATPINKHRPNTSEGYKSALLWALYSGGNTAAVVELLLESGADPKECDHLGKNAMGYAVQTKREELIALVTKYWINTP